jgi:hypothetical protein
MTSSRASAGAQAVGGIRYALHSPAAAMSAEADDAGRAVGSYENIEAGPAGIAEGWKAGAGISACLGPPKSSDGQPTFESAGLVAVAIDLAHLPLSAVLSAPFTQQYCSVAVHPEPGIDGDLSAGVCLLAFALPAVETDAARYGLLQAGLETRYAGARMSSGTVQVYGAAGMQRAEVRGHGLDPDAVRELAWLGKETKTLHRKPDELLRSRLKLELDSVIRTADGEWITFGDLHPDVEVFCPIHADARAMALTFRQADDRPVLGCARCQRTFTVRDASNDYDFGQFDRTVRALAAAEATPGAPANGACGDRQFDVRSERFLSGLTLKPGIYCIKSPKGSGKTECLEKLVNQCKALNLYVMILGHRRSLITALARRLRVWSYMVPTDVRETTAKTKWQRQVQKGHGIGPEDEETRNERRRLKVAGEILGESPASTTEGLPLRNGEPRHYYAISLDSLPMLDPKRDQYPVVIIDEAEQVFAHLVGKTLRDKRLEVFHRLRHYLRVAETVILLDADLGMVTMDSMFAMGLKPEVPVSFVLNDYRQDRGAVLEYPKLGQLVERLRDAVAAGEKCYVATNSKNKAIELEKVLAKVRPECRILTIHADNASNARALEFLKDIAYEFERNVDVLIASPALGTGIDITFKDGDGAGRTVVEHVFGIFMGNITTHQDIDQQLMRVRQPGQVHVWVDPVEQYFETDVGVIKEQLTRTVGEARALLGYEDDGTPTLGPEDGLADIWARVRAASRGSRNRLAPLFRQLRAESGWRIEAVGSDEDGMKAGTAALKEGKDLRVEEREQQIMAARTLDAPMAEALEKRDRDGAPLGQEDRAALERFRIERAYGEAVSPELVDFDAGGRTRPAVRLLEIMLAPDEVNEKIDGDQLDRRDDVQWVGDLGARCVRARLMREVLAAAGVYDMKGRRLNDEAVVEQDCLGPFVAALRSNRKQFESVFEVVPRKDADRKRVMQLGVVLGMVGLELDHAEVTDAGGKKVRRYRLNPGLLERMRAVLQQREAVREEARRLREAESAKRADSIDLPAMAERLRALRDTFSPG